MPIKSVKMKISKNKKKCISFLCPKDRSTQKIRFLAQKLWSVARIQRNRHTDRHESEYRGHPFRVSGIFPSTYHQGSVQYFLLSFPLTGGTHQTERVRSVLVHFPSFRYSPTRRRSFKRRHDATISKPVDRD